MMDVITQANADRHARTLDSMFALRDVVFNERLGWGLHAEEGCERDQFDRPDTTYLTLRNRRGLVVASARLLPTDKPYLLGEVFPYLVAGGRAPHSALVWEVSRLAVDHRKENIDPLPGARSIAGALFSGIVEFALHRGLSDLISVSDLRLERILKRAGWNVLRLGASNRVGTMDIVGERLAVNRENLDSIRRRSGVTADMITRRALSEAGLSPDTPRTTKEAAR